MAFIPEKKNNKPQEVKKKFGQDPFYNSHKWRKFAKAHKKDNPFCVECLKVGIYKRADVTDHIKPIIDGGAKFDLSNLQSLCHRHHNRKRGKERAKKYESKTKTET